MFYCGKVGHSERNCSVRKSDAISGTLQEGQYREWLKTDIVMGSFKQSISAAKNRLGRDGDKDKFQGNKDDSRGRIVTAASHNTFQEPDIVLREEG